MKTITINEAYGSYAVPETVRRLYRLEEELQRSGLSLALIGLQPLDRYFHCSATPPDVIPFALTGGPGVHFGFLTEFGEADSLEEAPIVCVSPTNDPPVRLIARHFREFADLVSSVPYAEDLEQWWSCGDEQRMAAELEAWESDWPQEWTDRRRQVMDRFSSTFRTERRPVVSYISDVLKERAESMVLPTLDGLGIAGNRELCGSCRSFPFDVPHDEGGKPLERMRTFLDTAGREEKLGFVRDANFRYLLNRRCDADVQVVAIELLLSLGLRDEAVRLAVR